MLPLWTIVQRAKFPARYSSLPRILIPAACALCAFPLRWIRMWRILSFASSPFWAQRWRFPMSLYSKSHNTLVNFRIQNRAEENFFHPVSFPACPALASTADAIIPEQLLCLLVFRKNISQIKKTDLLACPPGRVLNPLPGTDATLSSKRCHPLRRRIVIHPRSSKSALHSAQAAICFPACLPGNRRAPAHPLPPDRR